MFDWDSRPTITELMVESADSGLELSDSTVDSAANPLKIGLWVRALRPYDIIRVSTLTFWAVSHQGRHPLFSCLNQKCCQSSGPMLM